MTKTKKIAHSLRIPGYPGQLDMLVHEGTDIHISRSISESGIWEPEETQFILDLLKPGQTFVDVGANIGYFTLLASRLVGSNGRVFSFEPDEDNYQLLSSNCELNRCGNVDAFKAALSNKTTEGRLYLSEANMGDHTIYAAGEDRKSTKISLLNGEDVFLNDDRKIDFIKIDTQGSEYQVLEGLSSTIEKNLPELVMIVEFSPNSMKKTGHTGEDFLDLFSDFHGEFYLLGEHHAGLIPITRELLLKWSNLTSMDDSSEGFLNLVFSGVPIRSCYSGTIVEDLGLFDNALEYLTSYGLTPWDGEKCLTNASNQHLFFSSGWSFPEGWGIWSAGSESWIKCYLGDKLKAARQRTLRIHGRYFGTEEDTGLEINGVPLGNHNLKSLELELPETLFHNGHIAIKLSHNKPLRPMDTEGGVDCRELKFGLESIEIVTTD